MLIYYLLKYLLITPQISHITHRKSFKKENIINIMTHYSSEIKSQRQSKNDFSAANADLLLNQIFVNSFSNYTYNYTEKSFQI